jgi:hypothetical protein
VLYVVDSVTRKWLDHAKAEGQTIDGSSEDGTFAAGIHRMRELMPVLMNDIIQSAPPTHKVSFLFFASRLMAVPGTTDTHESHCCP